MNDAVTALINSGVTGAMLVIAGGALFYITKRFVDHLEKLAAASAVEREAQLKVYSVLASGIEVDRVRRVGYEAWITDAIKDFVTQLDRIENAMASLKAIERLLEELRQRMTIASKEVGGIHE